MKWMRERDLLIAQTMAFVQSVTGKRPDADKLVANSTAAEASRPAAFMPDLEALLADTTLVDTTLIDTTLADTRAAAPQPAQIARPDIRGDFQSEIRTRVANFRAHQERFHREREAYCSATMAKVHAALRDGSAPPRLGK